MKEKTKNKIKLFLIAVTTFLGVLIRAISAGKDSTGYAIIRVIYLLLLLYLIIFMVFRYEQYSKKFDIQNRKKKWIFKHAISHV